MTKELTVWWDNREVGTLCINEHGDMEFTYASAWLSSPARVSISRSLPLQAGTFGRRAGKAPCYSCRDRIALPAPGQPTSHILKPPISRFEGTTENEGLAMRLAGLIGLNTAPIEIREARDRRFLLVERCDRIIENGVAK